MKRAAGWADFTGQLCAALEQSEALREGLEARLSLLSHELDRTSYDLSVVETRLIEQVEQGPDPVTEAFNLVDDSEDSDASHS